MPTALEVRLQALDGTWETVGVDRYPGVVAEAFQAGSNEWGYDTCQFVLRRPTNVQHPDLSSFTPCEIYRAGAFVWEGRVRETPTTDGPDGQINVSGVGWQAHLDDDQYGAVYVQTDLTAWQDVRARLTTDLTKFRTAPQVESGAGGVVLTFPKDFTGVTGDAVGALIDLGPDPRRWIKRISLLVEHTGTGAASIMLNCVGHDTEAEAYAGVGNIENAFVAAASSTLSAPTGSPTTGTTKAGTFTNYHRFVTIFLKYTGAGATFGFDHGVKIKAALLAREAAYEAAGASTLKAPVIVKDALDQCCPKLAADRTEIDPNGLATFVLPEFTLDAPQTPRDVIQAVNAVHRWRTRIKRNRVPEFAPQPNAPLFKVGAWPGSRFQDASAGSGEEIYNRALVTGTGPDGADIAVERTTAHSSIVPFALLLDTPQPSNGNFDSNVTGWQADPQANAGGVAWDNAIADTGAGSLKITAGPSSGFFRTSFIGGLTKPLVVGKRYRLRLRIRFAVTPVDVQVSVYKDGPNAQTNLNTPMSDFANNADIESAAGKVVGTWYTIERDFTASDRTARIFIAAFSGSSAASGAAVCNVDNVGLLDSVGTLVDRRGFVRTMQIAIQSALTVALGQQIADIFLATHARTPLKGSIDIQPGGLRLVATDEEVHPSELLNHPTELIRLAHLVDPDTGAVGRDGIIATVNYTEDNETASVQLDNDRNSLEALLARMAIVTGAAARRTS